MWLGRSISSLNASRPRQSIITSVSSADSTLLGVHDSVLVSSDPARHAAWLHELVELGVDEIYVHQVPRDQDGFLDVYADKVLPELRAAQEGQR